VFSLFFLSPIPSVINCFEFQIPAQTSRWKISNDITAQNPTTQIRAKTRAETERLAGELRPLVCSRVSSGR
jgi:hypothetical protein